MAVRGTIVTRLEMPGIRGASESAKYAAAKQVEAELQAKIERECSRDAPPASRPYQYPRRRTGEFVDGVNVTVTPRFVTIASEAEHGVYLQYGTLNMAPRPWADKALGSKDWAERYKQLAKR